MDVGVVLPNYGKIASREGIVEVACAAEELGFDSIWTTDHLLMPKGYEQPYGHLYESLVTLSYVAALTRRLRLGTSIIVLPMRNPILLAKEVAALDNLSGGRVILGVGVGWLKREFELLNADFRGRGKITDEWINAMRALWREEDPSFDGQRIKFSDVVFSPKPLQHGGPPIWIGGVSDAAIRRAAQLGDAWHPTGLDPERFAQGMRRLRELAGPPRRVIGSLRLRVTMGEKPESYKSASGMLMHAVGGSPDEVLNALRRYQEAGLEHLAANFGDEDLKLTLKAMEKFAKEVMPALRHR